MLVLPGLDLNAPYLPGFTNDQAFFISFGQLWCTKQTDQSLRNQVLSNPHSPGHFRVNGKKKKNSTQQNIFQYFFFFFFFFFAKNRLR
jgi:predicted metalloendopeptidase